MSRQGWPLRRKPNELGKAGSWLLPVFILIHSKLSIKSDIFC